ncbi:hypothetical protein QTP86_000832 [Hemibagrus guttatus]|nr:hypothetical protein QTP86_000832 [Hemibagrus guttatus]
MNYRGKTWVFKGEGCEAAFFKTFRRRHFKGYTFIAHNARGFDSYLLLNHLVKEGITPDIIAQGGKILCFTDSAFRQNYIDSLSFLPMKLSSLPKAMGFSEKKKGYFPHFWNTLEHQNYVGPYPEPKFYGADSMMPKDREDFFKWYATVSGKVFNFNKEMFEYCMNDVDILRQGCIAFRNEILQSTKVDPFKCITIMFADIYNVSHFSFLSDEVALAQWRYKDDRMIKPGNANVFIGIFTTAYARLELYNLMDQLKERCLYTDTDSVIFKSKRR